ncbi:hypothetical protein Tdes44962_MAKER08055 [Teratosphaeria destructans]|uniref:DUF7703 domain-containing protein n=1 Tax=Teratosphaeria destructans TaxID=418781 RepID=A0A9W7W546_9PEZI|nr:hypothetical protein Tdes44962_MAKER08055 [Teratosphaeria destructans]
MASSVNDERSYWNGDFDAQTLSIIITCSVSVYNASELLIWIAATFDRARGLYFWSLLAATTGLLPYNLGIILTYFRFASDAVGLAFGWVGWSAVITGQSLVLYSRLAFILNDRRILKILKWVIIVNGVTWHTSTQAIHYCSRYGPDSTQSQCSMAYSVVEKLQMTVFCLQEFTISGIYMWQTARLMSVLQRHKTRKVMQELFLVNLLIIFMDIVLLVVEYLDYLALEGSIKAFIYSVKLKVEFLILGKLIDLVRASVRKYGRTHLRDYSNGRAREVDPGGACEDSTMPKWLCQAEERDHGMCEVANGHALRRDLSMSMTAEERRRRQLTETDPYAEALRSMSTRGGSDGCPA